MNKILTSKLGKKFVNHLMVNGKKNKAEQILLETLTLLDKNAAHILTRAVENVKPLLEVRSIRLRGTNHQVPIPLKQDRRISLGIKWIIESARKKKGKSISGKLKEEILLASKKQGESLKKKIASHKLASAHRAFVHFRWF